MIKFLCSKEDCDLIAYLKNIDGGKLQFSEEFDFIGDTILSYVIPTAALCFQILDFIFTHLRNDEKNPKGKKGAYKKDIDKKRKIEVDGERIAIYIYSTEELRAILRTLGLEE